MPRRVVAHVLRQRCIDEVELARPDARRLVEHGVGRRGVRSGAAPVARGEQPLAVRPRVVVLRVDGEAALDERELAARLARERDEQAAVVPDLVRLEEGHRELVHQRELRGEQRWDIWLRARLCVLGRRWQQREERFVAVLPGRGQISAIAGRRAYHAE